MQEEMMAGPVDQTARRYRNQRIFEMTQAALSGLLAATTNPSDEQIETAAKGAVLAAKLAVKELIKQRIL